MGGRGGGGGGGGIGLWAWGEGSIYITVDPRLSGHLWPNRFFPHAG